MKLHWKVPAMAAAVFALAACNQSSPVSPTMGGPAGPTAVKTADNSNGSPSGAHYNLNIIGVPKGKSADMTGNNGHRIFVDLTGNTKINLTMGDDYQVLDANGTDNDGALFQLPNPDPDNDGETVYSVYARALGKLGGSVEVTTCATSKFDGLEYCSTESLVKVRVKGAKFSNVSRELLYIYVDLLQGDGLQRYNLFHNDLQDYFWSYDNNGLKLLQLRFYECSTNVETGVTTCFE